MYYIGFRFKLIMLAERLETDNYRKKRLIVKHRDQGIK